VTNQGRNIVLCLDGTGNQLKAKGNFNVVLLYRMPDLADPQRQVGFYDPGMGTFAAKGAWTGLPRKRLSKLLGLPFGYCKRKPGGGQRVPDGPLPTGGPRETTPQGTTTRAVVKML
jgi:uncharacterized protein (DUF2235 family)